MLGFIGSRLQANSPPTPLYSAADGASTKSIIHECRSTDGGGVGSPGQDLGRPGDTNGYGSFDSADLTLVPVWIRGSGVQKFIFRGYHMLPYEMFMTAKNEFLKTRPLASVMITRVAILFLCLKSVAIFAKDLPVRPRNPEGNFIVPGVMGDIVYRQVDGHQLALDAYVQKKGKHRPAVIVIHGGGWTSGSRISRVGQLLELLTRSGFNWFCIDYRLAPKYKYPQAIDDVRAALEFIRRHASEFQIDKHRIALLGEDTGAHLATMLAMEKPLGVKALVSLGGFYDLRSLDRMDGDGYVTVFGEDQFRRRTEVLREASPTVNVSQDMPATLIVHGTRDNEAPLYQVKEFVKSIETVGGHCEMVLEKDAIHAVENWRPEQWSYKKRVVAFLSEQLRLDSPDFVPYVTRLRKDVVYGSYQGKAGQKVDLLLDAWKPKGAGPFPAIILVHGGGWEAGDKVTYLTPILEPLSRAGFAWFSIDYRLTPTHRHPAQLADVRRAIRYVRHHAEKLQIDRDRIAILGESASGQMVLQVAAQSSEGLATAADAVDREPCMVRAAVSFYGVYDFLPMVTDAAPGSLLPRLFGVNTLDAQARQLLKQYSPLYHVHEKMPPVLLVHGTNERLWQQGQSLQKRLSSAGVQHKLHALQGAPHGMENWEGHPEWTGYKEVVVDWLTHHLEHSATTNGLLHWLD